MIFSGADRIIINVTIECYFFKKACRFSWSDFIKIDKDVTMYKTLHLIHVNEQQCFTRI